MHDCFTSALLAQFLAIQPEPEPNIETLPLPTLPPCHPSWCASSCGPKPNTSPKQFKGDEVCAL